MLSNCLLMKGSAIYALTTVSLGILLKFAGFSSWDQAVWVQFL